MKKNNQSIVNRIVAAANDLGEGNDIFDDFEDEGLFD